MSARNLSDAPILLRDQRILVVEDEAIVAMLIEDEPPKPRPQAAQSGGAISDEAAWMNPMPRACTPNPTARTTAA